jgi:hypothetical protein
VLVRNARCCTDRCLRAVEEVRFGAAQHLSLFAKPDGDSPPRRRSAPGPTSRVTSKHRSRCVLCVNPQPNPDRSSNPLGFSHSQHSPTPVVPDGVRVSSHCVVPRIETRDLEDHWASRE